MTQTFSPRIRLGIAAAALLAPFAGAARAQVESQRALKDVYSGNFLVGAAINPPQFDAEFHTGADIEKRRVSGIAVSNNLLGDGQIHANGVNGGVLGVYIAAPLSTSALLKLMADLFMGTWRASPAVTEKQVNEVTLHFPRRKRGAHAVIDGELIRLDRSVTLRIHPGALKVVMPKPTLPAQPA
mgnify:CR=1 FL=1